MINATEDISARLGSLRHSVLILHGGADTVTCPSMSADLYSSCQVRGGSATILDCNHSSLSCCILAVFLLAYSLLHCSCQSADKHLQIYPGCLHGLMKADDEPLFPQIFGDVIAWLHARGDGDTVAPAVAAKKQRRASLRKKRA
jgi:alpha-beta hydrolase superfamily lysophospholipase